MSPVKSSDYHTKQKILYTAIGLVTGFIATLYTIDQLLTNFKPNFIKINGKVDKNRQFSYSIAITFIIFIILIFSLYQIFA
jgi:hypothetical protein